jgi:hypothetical protein
MNELMMSFKNAKETNDTNKLKQLEQKGQLLQRIAHDKGFGRGSVAEILEKKKIQLDILAKSENLIAIVSKWELNYSDPNIEVVDITLKMLDLLNAPEKIKKMYEEFKAIPPVENAMFMNLND